jgi:ABC-type multidrug transport system fused ATPase/permease subunit
MFWINSVIRYFLEVSVLLIGILILAVLGLTTDLRHAVTVLVAFIAVGFRLLPNVQRIQNSIVSLRISEGATRSLFDFSDRLSVMPEKRQLETEAQAFGLIELRELSFHYPLKNSKFVLGPLTFKVDAQKTTVILGSSGSGKSTLLDLICKLNQPSSGEINFLDTNGQSMSKFPSMGLVSQRSSLFGGTIQQNIAFATPEREFDEKLANDAITLLNLTEFSANKMNTSIRSDGTNLSGGERQRISMARVVYSNPEMVVLDEPTSSLDPENKGVIYEFLRGVRGAKTVIIVTHDRELIEFSDTVIEIEEGRLKFQGSPDEFKKSN